MSKSTCDVRQDGDHVTLTIDGRTWRLPWQAALDMGKALLSQGRRAEEVALANRIIADQALLIRAGAPFSVSDHPKIRDAAMQEAQWGGLRRYLPAKYRGVVFGVPSIKQERPR